jgi:CCR4-NOT transcriptional complex subunit CAF120
MAPMITGQMTGQMGFPGMMPGYNPQHMFAAQQAAQAYQQAMMAFSVAGSQVGGEAGNVGQPGINPAMTGGNMSGFDPRMSMMGMPMMGTPQMAPQMTGMSAFDPRFSPTMNDAGLVPPAGLGAQGSGQTSPHNSSPRGSPLARPTDGGRTSSRPATPKS